MRQHSLAILAGFLFLAFCDLAAAEEKAAKTVKKTPGIADSDHRVIYNLDCTEFFVGSFGPVVPETIDQWVDEHAAAGVTDLFINVNAQRANYRSEVWEAWWDGYDPKLGVDQPFFAGIPEKRRNGPDANESQMYISMRALSEGGCDYPRRMIDRARRNKIKPWISLRMNDGHSQGIPEHPSHSTIWKSHPQWRLAYGLDYEQPEVRKHHLKLVQEVCSRYDLDGLELDFERFWLYFRAGREHEGVKLMTAFLEETRQATAGAAKRLGHPVKLAVRVPSSPWIARRHGLDAVAWAKAGLVDLIIASPFWFSANSDIPVETWKGLLIGTGCEVAVSLEDALNSGASGRRTMTHEEMRGVLTSGLHRGADAVYFFNLFTGPFHTWPRKDYDRLMKDAGSYKALSDHPRRHALTITAPWSAGEPRPASLLPHTGKQGAFRLHIGPKPGAKQRARVELKLSGSVSSPDVKVNGILCSKPVKPPEQGQRYIYDVPASAVSEGYNLVEVVAEKDVEITWVEISVR